MSTFVTTNSYTYSVTYVTDNILRSLKLIILLSGLSPEKLTSDWESLERGIKTWLNGNFLQEIHLEVYDPRNDQLLGRWDFEIRNDFTSNGEFWADTDDIRYHIKKAGTLPSHCNYRIMISTKPGRPDIEGWRTVPFRPADGFVKQSIGTTINGSGLRTGTSYWRKN